MLVYIAYNIHNLRSKFLISAVNGSVEIILLACIVYMYQHNSYLLIFILCVCVECVVYKQNTQNIRTHIIHT